MIDGSTLDFMIQAHMGQTRKDGSPYWYHPFYVWQSMQRSLKIDHEAMETAALLHDVVEDTRVGLDIIRDRFGDEVANIVAELTNDESLPKKEKKAAMIQKALNISNEARIIKCFDRMHNLVDGMTAFSHTGIWHYTKEAILLCKNLVEGTKDDKLFFFARQATKLLEKTIDKVADRCHNELKIPEFAGFAQFRAENMYSNSLKIFLTD